MEIERMLYRRYKTSYADCETVLGSYDKATKTIEVKNIRLARGIYLDG